MNIKIKNVKGYYNHKTKLLSMDDRTIYRSVVDVDDKVCRECAFNGKACPRIDCDGDDLLCEFFSAIGKPNYFVFLGTDD